MNGWDPGGKECPTNLMFRQTVGSMSSLTASSYLDFFIEPRSVFVFESVWLFLMAFCCSWARILLFLLRPPLLRLTKHWAIWKKYWSGSYGAKSTWKLKEELASILWVSGLILKGFLTHCWVVGLRTLRRAQLTSTENGYLFETVSYLDSLILPDSAKLKSRKSMLNLTSLFSLVTSMNISLCKTTWVGSSIGIS